MSDGREGPPAFTDIDFNKPEPDEDMFQSALEETTPSDEFAAAKNNPFGGGSDMTPPDFTKIDLGRDSQSREEADRDDASQTSLTSTTISKINYVSDSSSSTERDREEPFTAPKRVITEDEGKEEDDKFVTVTVSEPQKVNEGLQAYVQYKVSTETNLAVFRRRKFSVVRRFSDFLGLHEKLQEKHVHVGRFVPPAPEKSVAGMAKVKMSKGDTTAPDGASGEFVERRRAALERFLARTAQHPVLRMDPDLREFLEMDETLPKASNTSAFSGAGVMRLFGKVGEQVTRITSKMEEKDEWFEEKTSQIDNMEMQLKKLHASVESLYHHRRDLANATGMFAKSAAMLANCEEHTSLSRALSQLAETEEKIDLLYQEQGTTDYYVLAEMLRDYIGLLTTVKEVLHQRTKIYANWTSAQSTLAKKREAKVKLELAGKHDKIQAASDEVREWEDKVEQGEKDFNDISKMIKKEMERFDKIRVKDFKETLVKYLEALMLHQQQLIKYWEAFLPEARSISTA
ncbi:sorting nexin-2-like [Paramacrobiotus metropolitanus]|uniref:sorting nexin-2-like n=1 Tax=Paramacrobiotus metropolitanus TaxID=2943436 RepID=UPI0024457830|nr:sorting nexin-2-like [Paramacrobiotus metropolitanus]